MVPLAEVVVLADELSALALSFARRFRADFESEEVAEVEVFVAVAVVCPDLSRESASR